MPKKIHRQKGMTFVSWLVIALVGITILILGIRLVPAYLESFAVKKSLESLAEEKGILKKSPASVKDLLSRRFQVNEVRHVDPKALKIEKVGDQHQLRLDYEIRVRALGNIDAVLRFDQKVTVEQ
ncbi:MAG TPA: DUF4845 domain-containing protein [Gammaproteobacteria bacterium]|nr:DUF4845 domain-containing protein [Gammaproteobacteria bacterium]